MASTIPDADAVNWIIGPAGRCASYAAEETRVASVLHRAIIVLSGLDPFLVLARRALEAADKPTIQMDLLLAEQRTLGPWAKELLDSNFHPINSHALIGLWTTIEVAVEDTVCLILLKNPDALGSAIRAGVSWQISKAAALNVEGARRIYARLERLTRKTLTVGESYCHILSIFGIRLSLSAETLATLAEINYVRNCLLHRGGIADQRSAVEVPRLGLLAGQEVKVTSGHYQRYFKEVGEFAHAFLEATIHSKYVRTKASDLGT